MSILNRIFGTKIGATKKTSETQIITPEFDRLLAFGRALMCLLNEDRYIARSDYKPIIEEYSDTKDYFISLQKANVLSMYCEKNGFEEERMTMTDSLLKQY